MIKVVYYNNFISV